MTAQTIISAFRCSGMWPINPSIFDDHDFAPSLHTSFHTPAPVTYPTHIPSSPFSGRTTDDTDVDWIATEPNTPSSASSYGATTTIVSDSDIPVCTVTHITHGCRSQMTCLTQPMKSQTIHSPAHPQSLTQPTTPWMIHSSASIQSHTRPLAHRPNLLSLSAPVLTPKALTHAM